LWYNCKIIKIEKKNIQTKDTFLYLEQEILF
jgi:hypothetical protein